MAPSPRRRAAWVLLTISGLSLLFAWAVASPIGASPDEPAHVWFAWGTVTGQTFASEHLVPIVPGEMATAIRVPQKLLQHPNPICYMAKAYRPVNTCIPIPADNGQLLTQKSYMTRYPPVYYAFEGAVLRTGVTANLSGSRVLYGARLASALLILLTVVFGVFLLARRFPARVVLLATLLALPAMTWFLAASVNPNGLEIAAAFLLAAGVLSMRFDFAAGVRSTAAVVAVPLGTLLLAWSRPLSWVWAGLILALLLVPCGRPERQSWMKRLPILKLGVAATAATILVLASSMVWFLYAVQIRTVANPNEASWASLNPLGRIALLLVGLGTIASEQIGNFGWEDTPLPDGAVFAWVAVTAVAAAAWVMGRHTLVPRWSLGAVLGLGYLAALLEEYAGGWVWQGRYLLPVTAAVCVFALPGLKSGLERWKASEAMVCGMLVVLMAVNALSVVWFLFRNEYGVLDLTLRRIPSTPLPVGMAKWIPPLGQSVVLVLVTLALAGGVVAVWALAPALRAASSQLPPEASSEMSPEAVTKPGASRGST
jgi:Predicted membrane protein (DUF2142)